MRLNLGSGGHPLDGFDNLDLPGWRFEDGLGYADESVEAITISHALMYVVGDDWPAVFAELARVLESGGGVVRITEDSTSDPESERFGGHPDAVTLTSPLLVLDHLRDAGLGATEVSADVSFFSDYSLIQRWHGDPPKVFHVEGFK